MERRVFTTGSSTISEVGAKVTVTIESELHTQNALLAAGNKNN